MPSVPTFRQALYNQAIGGGVNCGTAASVTDLAQGTIMAWYRTDSLNNAARTLVGKLSVGGGWTINTNDVADGTRAFFSATRALSNHTVIGPSGYNKIGSTSFLCTTWDINNSANAGMWGAHNGDPAIDLVATVAAGAGVQATDAASALTLLAPTTLANRQFGPVWVIGLWNTPITDLQRIRYWQFNPSRVFGGLIGLWDANNGGIFVLDRSGVGNHGLGTSVSPIDFTLPYVYTQRRGAFRTIPRRFILIPGR